MTTRNYLLNKLLSFKNYLLNKFFSLIRPLFVDRVDPNEDYLCISCGHPVLTRTLYCGKCTKRICNGPKKYHFCDKCSEPAVWWYMPSCHDMYYCDDHVSRGCSCNVDPTTGVEDTDEQGRLLPCCEFGYSPGGHWEYLLD